MLQVTQLNYGADGKGTIPAELSLPLTRLLLQMNSDPA